MSPRIGRGASALVLALAAGCLGLPAHASDAAGAATTPAATGAATVGEVVVTAEKRSENLETTPVAITAFSAKDRELLGIQSVQDLTDYTPGLAYSTFDNRPYIRGIGRQTDNLAIESGVAVYVNGIYGGANASTILQLDTMFIDNIDVLRGPQSTLYGRNADGGAINYESRKPSHTFTGEVRSGYDNYQKYWAEGTISGPINDHLRFRVGGNYTDQRGGYYNNLTGAQEGGSVAQGGNGMSYHVEAQLEGELSDKFDFWSMISTSDYDVSYHTESLQGPLDTREFYDPLMPNQNYGLCALPGSGVNPGCAAGTNPDKLVSVTTLPGALATNPSNTNPRNFSSDFFSRSRERDNLSLAVTGTWHGPGFDVKYLGGFQTFKYYLNAPWLYSQGISSPVESYVLQGPATATGLCSAIYNNAGCTQNLTVNPAQTQFTFVENESFFSHELDFTSTGNGRLQWIAGLYWYHENYDQPINVLDPNQPQVMSPLYFTFKPAPANPSGSVYNEDTRLVENSYAAFGQVDWKVTDTIKLTGGLRYTEDQKYGEEAFRLALFNFEGAGLGVNTFGANTPAFDATSCPAGVFPGAGACSINPTTGAAQRHLDAIWRALTGTAGIAWTPDPTTFVYAKYSRGYKTGGFNSGTVTVSPETLPETVNAFEIGLKKTAASNLQINLTGFYYDYSNDQQPLGANINGVVNTVIINLPTVHSYGVELESIWKPIKPLTLALNYAYLHATISNTNGQCFEDTADPLALAPGANTKGCTGSTATAVLQNLSGQSVPESPTSKVTATAIYSFPMTIIDSGVTSLSGAFIYKSGEYNSPFNRAYNYAPGYTQVNLRASFTDDRNRYTVIAYATNIFNTLGYDAAVGIPVSNPGPGQVIDRLASYTAPRTYGVEVQFRF
jgi:iron complex outermembrane receptor protein